MIDFIGKLLFKRIPDTIQNDEPQLLANSDMAKSSPDVENIVVAQALVSHLNEILDWKDRVDSINYLANEAAKAAGNITYTTSEDQMMAAITAIGGSNGVVDFELAKTAMALVFDMYDLMALSSLTGMNIDA